MPSLRENLALARFKRKADWSFKNLKFDADVWLVNAIVRKLRTNRN